MQRIPPPRRPRPDPRRRLGPAHPAALPEGAPNLAALASIRITDPALILRAGPGDGGPQALHRRWSWVGSHGRPVYNVRFEEQSRSDGARAGRCLIPADGFYEFTAPKPGHKRKTKWLFTHARDDWFAIGGVWRGAPGAEAFANGRSRRSATRSSLPTGTAANRPAGSG